MVFDSARSGRTATLALLVDESEDCDEPNWAWQTSLGQGHAGPWPVREKTLVLKPLSQLLNENPTA
jgi:hypothetical protein